MLAQEPRKPSLGLFMAFRTLLCLFSAACLAKQPNVIFARAVDREVADGVAQAVEAAGELRA